MPHDAFMELGHAPLGILSLHSKKATKKIKSHNNNYRNNKNIPWSRFSAMHVTALNLSLAQNWPGDVPAPPMEAANNFNSYLRMKSRLYGADGHLTAWTIL